MTPKELASVVLRAAEIREESWDDAEGEYLIHMSAAVQQAVAEAEIDMDFWYPIHLAFHWWDDILSWADHISRGKHVETMFTRFELDKVEEKEES